MSPLEISIWETGRPIVAQHNVFLKQDFRKIKKAYRKQLRTDKTPLGCRFYITLPNGSQHLELVKEHISIRHFKSSHADEKPNGPAALGELISALSELSQARIEKTITAAKKHAFPPDIYLALELLSEVNETLISWLEDKSPFIFSVADNSNKAWWKAQPRARGKATSIAHKMKKLFAGTIPEQLISLNNWLTKLDNNINNFCENKALGWGTSHAVAHASAYCAGIAERQLLHGNHNLAVIFFHRSTDLLLYSICAEQGLINFSRNSGFGAYKTNAALPVTLKNSMFELTNYLTNNVTRDKLFDDLNCWRNQLIQTHYLTNADRSTIDKLAIELRAQLEKIATREWINARDFFNSHPIITYPEIIDINNCTSQLYKEIKI